jgi:GNAT superfamily N-acetyltransferase
MQGMLERMDAYVIEETAVPASAASPGWDDFVGVVEVRNAVEVAGYGIPEVVDPAEDLRAEWDDPYEPRRMFVVRDAGRVVAYGSASWLAGDGPEPPDAAWVDVRVLPEYEGRGIGRMLADRVEQIARDLGVARMINYGVSAAGAGERLEAATGFGSVPRDNREVRFRLARGWTLEQVERGSRLALPVDADELARRLAEATAASGPDYRVHEWVVPTPERWRAGLAELYTRMSTDAPQGELGEPEDPWTVERLVQREAGVPGAEIRLLTAAVEHVPSGRLVGFTQLKVPDEQGTAASQWDTIVVREHRGRRLGMLLKLANFDHLQRVAPGHASILTWNAEENRPMLDVNEAVGFTPIGYEGAWKLSLSS